MHNNIPVKVKALKIESIQRNLSEILEPDIWDLHSFDLAECGSKCPEYRQEQKIHRFGQEVCYMYRMSVPRSLFQ
jgi:hypothetical protein